MEPDGSLPCSQKPATGPYPEPLEYISHYPRLRWVQIFLSQQRRGFPRGLVLSDLPRNTFYAFQSSHMHAACPTNLALFDMIIFP
jgi:hypothetical protein